MPAEPQPAACPDRGGKLRRRAFGGGEAAVEEPALPEEEDSEGWYLSALFGLIFGKEASNWALGLGWNSETLNYLLGVDAKTRD